MDTKINIGYKYNIIYEYEMNIECGYGYKHSTVLDMNMDMGMRYGMLFDPCCLSITLVSKNYKRGGEGMKILKF